MRCPKCETEIENGLIYCPNCGESIQLVPNYDILEEELLTSIVEDKRKVVTGIDKFAEGVYKIPEVQPESQIQPEAENDKKLNWIDFVKEKLIALYKNVVFRVAAVFVLSLLIIIGIYSGYKAYTNSFSYLYEQAQLAEKKEKYTDAVYFYRQASIADENSYEAFYNLGRMCFEIGDYEGCKNAMLKALELDENTTEVYSCLVNSYVNLHETKAIYDLLGNTSNQAIQELITSFIIFPPLFSHEEGEYNQDIDLELSSVDGYNVYYTTDGKDPTNQGFKFRYGLTLTEGTTTVKAVCCSPEGEYGEIITKTYTIAYDAPAMPIVTPSGGLFFENTMISIEVPEGSKAYYTWDGTVPTETSNCYNGPFSVIPGSSVLSVVIIDKHGNSSSLYQSEFYFIQ